MSKPHTSPSACDFDEVSAADEQEIAERESKRLLGISFAEFTRRWFAGEYRGNPDPKVIDLAFYLR